MNGRSNSGAAWVPIRIRSAKPWPAYRPGRWPKGAISAWARGRIGRSQGAQVGESPPSVLSCSKKTSVCKTPKPGVGPSLYKLRHDGANDQKDADYRQYPGDGASDLKNLTTHWLIRGGKQKTLRRVDAASSVGAAGLEFDLFNPLKRAASCAMPDCNVDYIRLEGNEQTARGHANGRSSAQTAPGEQPANSEGQDEIVSRVNQDIRSYCCACE